MGRPKLKNPKITVSAKCDPEKVEMALDKKIDMNEMIRTALDKAILEKVKACPLCKQQLRGKTS